MCTAVSFNAGNHYFGRNLDYEHGFGEKIIITPRNFILKFKKYKPLHKHPAIIGMGTDIDGYPLYFDATNEYGLSIAALNFPGNATYFNPTAHPAGITPYELIPWLLAQCKTTDECIPLLDRLYIIDIPFSPTVALSPLHWLLADKNKSLVIESTSKGLQVYENPFGVLTNNPPFEYHLYNVSNYVNTTAKEATNRFAPNTKFKIYSRGMGGIGIPGDNSSASRFVRAAFTKLNCTKPENENEAVSQFFRILNNVYQVEGCTHVESGLEKTIYSSCCNTTKGIYYYTTYLNHQITAVHMHNYNLEQNKLCLTPLNNELQIINAL